MNQIRKLLALLLVLLLLTGCSAPGGKETEAPAQPPTETSAPVETVPETTEAPVPETTEVPVRQTTEAPTEETVPYEVTITPVITSSQTQVIVTTADEFLAAIAPDTEIIVDAPLIDFSQASNYGQNVSGQYYYWSEAFDGPELFIDSVSNLTIRGSGEDRTTNVLSSVPRYSNVLTFQNCSNIHVVGLTAGHTVEPGDCTGGVLQFINSQDILIENCGLFGCGTLGVIGYSSKNMQIVNNEIYECSIGGVEFTNCANVNVDGNIFRDLGGPVFRVYDCVSITCNGESVYNT